MIMKNCEPINRLREERLAKKQQAKAKAAQLWQDMDANEKTAVRFGMFPANRMRDAEKEGFDCHEIVCALMDCASNDGGMRT